MPASTDSDTASAAAKRGSGHPLRLDRWGRSEPAGYAGKRERLIDPARGTDAVRQLQRCFQRWSKALDHLAWPALVRLAANQPVDVNDADMWASGDE